MATKEEIKAALGEIMTEEKTAAQKHQKEEADAFELGLHTFMKDAGIHDPAEQKQFLGFCSQVASQSNHQ